MSKTLGFPKNNIQFIKSQNLGKSWLFWPIPWNQIEASQLWASDWIKKTVILIFMKSVKKLYFYPDFFFLQIKCYFFITPTEFECLHFEISKSVYSKPLPTSIKSSKPQAQRPSNPQAFNPKFEVIRAWGLKGLWACEFDGFRAWGLIKLYPKYFCSLGYLAPL